jgi:hypothetical protein
LQLSLLTKNYTAHGKTSGTKNEKSREIAGKMEFPKILTSAVHEA